MKRSLIIIYIYLTFLLNLYSVDNKTTILIIHSYSSCFSWTDDLHQGIIDALNEYESAPICHIVFLDSIFFEKSEYTESLYNEIKTKYKSTDFDGIITTDNSAFDFVKEYGEELFPHIPIVSCGINGTLFEYKNHPDITPIMERPNYYRTLMEASRYYPQLRRINVIVDSSCLGQVLLQEFQLEVQSLRDDIEINYIIDKSIDELVELCAHLPSNELIYLFPFFKDKNSTYFSQKRAEKLLAEASSVPILVSWFSQMETGVLGGCFQKPYVIGKNAVDILYDKLSVREIHDVYFGTNDSYVTFFDYKVIRKFSIDKKNLPENAQFINADSSFSQIHRRYRLQISGILSLLLILLIVFFLGMKNQKILNLKNRELINLKTDFINSQTEIIHTLGEVIEKRSNETGGHVRRVAQISGYLANKIGMSRQDAGLLEVASPLHDIGKIGIPERILDKPGPLTREEYEIVKTHTTIGRDILIDSDSRILTTARDIAYGHHEQWNGRGYPEGLQGKEIPLVARITMIADIYDALLSERPYKTKWEHPRVVQYMKDNRGILFDPWLIDIFLENIEEIREIYKEIIDCQLVC